MPGFLTILVLLLRLVIAAEEPELIGVDDLRENKRNPCLVVSRAAGTFPIRFKIMEPGLPEETADWQRTTIAEVDKIFPGFEKPNSMTVELYHYHPNDSPNASPRIHEMELHVAGARTRLKDRRLLNTATAHEYGHHLFHLNIGRRIRRQAVFITQEEVDYRLREEVYRLRADREEAQRKLYRFGGTDVSPAKAEALRELTEIRTELEVKEKQLETSYRWGQLWETHPGWGMAEVFSDLVSVLHEGELSAMPTYLKVVYDPMKAYASRDFAGELSPEGWTETEVHQLYGPARAVIGKFLAKNDFYKGREEAFAGKVLDAMAAELADLNAIRGSDPVYANGKHNFALTPQRLNERLIKHLERELSN